jgi:hypothetical protein
LIALKFLQEFLEVVLIGFVEESLLGDEEVQSARPEKRVKMAITSGITVGSRSNVYTSF